MSQRPLRVLIVHPDPATRQALEQTVRQLAVGAVSTHQACSPTEGLESAHRLDPTMVFLDLSEDPDLALDAARDLRRPGRLLVGLYNPLLRGESEVGFLRRANRAGIADSVPLPASEAEIREVLEAASPQSEAASHKAPVVTFVSHKGGVGTTTLAVATALAATEAASGEVVLCDGDLQFGDAAAHLGMVPPQDLGELAREMGDLGSLSTYVTVHPPTGLRVLASPRDPIDADRITPEQMSRILIALRRRFQLVVMDTHSQLDLLSLAILDLSDLIFVVTEAVAPKVLGTARFLELLAGQGFTKERVQVVLNRFADGEDNLEAVLVAEQLGREIDHVIEIDRAVGVATNRGVPLISSRPRAPFSKVAVRLAHHAMRAGALAPTEV